MKRIFKIISEPPKLAVIASAVIMIYVLFISQIGMADNGDFYRVINGNGIYKLDRYQSDQYLEYSSIDYGVYRYYNEYEDGLNSSQTLFIKTALALDRLFTGDDDIFDIRFLSVLICLWALMGIYLLVDYAYRGLGKLYGYLTAALAVVMFADTGYTAYFNSFYAEGIVFVSFLTAMASALQIFQNRRKPFPMLLLYIVSSLLLTTAKQQNAPLGVLLGLLTIPIMYSIRKNGNNETKQTKMLWTVLTTSCVLSLCVCGVLVYFLIPQEFVDINKYHSMTQGVLMVSENPETALEKFGIDPQYSLLDGTIYYERYPSVDVQGKELETAFYPKYGFLSIAGYYLANPGDFVKMLNLAAKNAYIIGPEGIGNYQRSAGKAPGEKAKLFTLHSYLKSRVAPKTVGFIILWILAILMLNVGNKKQMLLLLFAILMGVSQIIVSVIGAGDADLAKHIFLYNVVFDFVNYIFVSTVFFKWADKRRKKD